MASAGSIFVDLLLKDSSYQQGWQRARRTTQTGAQGIGGNLRMLERQFDRLLNPVNAFVFALGRLAAPIAAALSVQRIVQYSDAWARLEGRLSLVTDTSQGLITAQENLFEIAQNTRTSLDATVTLYQRLTSATKGLGVSQGEVLQFTEQLNKQLITAGLSGNEASAAIFQLTQAFNKGKLDGDEFRTILESAPPILEALERSLGKTRGEILQLSKDGKLAPQVLIDAVNSMSDVTDKRFANFRLTVGQAFTQLDNAVLKFVGTSDDANSATSRLANAISELAFIISSPEFKQGTDIIAEGIGLIADQATQGIQAILKLINVLSDLKKAGNEFLTEQQNREARFFGGDYFDKARAGGFVTEATVGDVGLDLASEFRNLNPAIPPRSGASTADTKAVSKAANELNRIYESRSRIIAGLTSEQQNYNELVADLNKLVESGKITDEERWSAIEFYLDETKDKTNDTMVDLEAISKRAAENMQDAFADFLFDPFQDGLDGMLKGFVDTIRRMIAEQTSKQLFGSIFGGGGGGLLGSLGTTLFGSSPASGVGPSMPGLFDGFFAEGGFIEPGHWGVAGEAGAEAIYGGRAGATVIPNGGKGGNTYVINAPGASKTELESVKQALFSLAGPGVIEQRVGSAQSRGIL